MCHLFSCLLSTQQPPQRRLLVIFRPRFGGAKFGNIDGVPNSNYRLLDEPYQLEKFNTPSIWRGEFSESKSKPDFAYPKPPNMSLIKVTANLNKKH